MKKIFPLILIFAISLVLSGADDYGDQQQPQPYQLAPGMEIKKIGDVNLVVPIGTRVHQEGSLVVVEPLDEYTARKFIDIEKHFAALEARQQELKEEVKALKEELNQALGIKPPAPSEVSPPEVIVK